MNYNQFIEGITGLKSALYDLFHLDVDQNELELKDIEVEQPEYSYNECMVLQKQYSYKVKLVTWFCNGPEKGREFEAYIEIPKMCERGFLIKGLQDDRIKWRAPVNYGEVKQCIGCRKKIPNKYIFISGVGSIYPFKSGKDLIPRIELNEYDDSNKVIKISLEKYLLDAGFKDITDIINGPFKIPEDYSDLTEEVKIPIEKLNRIENKFYQLTGVDSDLDKSNPILTPKFVYELVKTCIDNPGAFDVFTPIDLEFSDFHTTLFSKDIYRYKLIKNGLSRHLTKYRELNGSLIQKAIFATFNGLGNENAVQAGALSNALSFISQTNKVYFRSWKYGERNKSLLRYTDDFYGVICPAKTPESVGLCGIKNEFASSVKVDNDKLIITVLTKNGESKDLEYIEYFKSKILTSDSYNYVNNVTIPNKYGKLKIIYKGKFQSVDNSVDNYDYILLNPEAGLSYNSGLIPFLNRSDGTRLAMATNMTDQAVPIVGGRRSIITTKLSDTIYEKSDLNWKSDINGIVEDIYGGYIKIKDDNGKVHIIATPDEITSSTHSCNLFIPAVKIGDKVKKGDVLMESNSFRGKHLALTVPLKVAFINYSSKTDEDAFVISDRAAELMAHKLTREIFIDIPSGRNFLFNKDKILSRVESMKEDPKKLKHISDETLPVKSNSKELNEFGLPNEGDTFRTGELLAMCLCEADEDDPRRQLAEIAGISGDEILDYYNPMFLPVPYGIDKCKVESVRIYYKSYLKDNPEINKIIEYYEDIKNKKLQDLRDHLGNYKFLEKSYDLDNDKYGPELRIVIKVSAINSMKIGSKITNRYGGKGTISAIIPYNEMPRIGGENGTPVDICVPPKSVINRKNFAQMYESNLAELSKLAYKMNSDYIKNNEFNMVKDVLNHLYVTEKFSNYTNEELKKFHNEFDEYYTIEVGAIDHVYTNEVFIELNKYFGYNISGDPVYIPKSDEYGPRWVKQEFNATHGTIEFQRLHFNADDKAKATSALGYHDDLVIGIGRGREGGQRIGQMEVWALIAHDTLKEFQELSKVAGKIDEASDYTGNSVTTQMLLIGLLTKKS